MPDFTSAGGEVAKRLKATVDFFDPEKGYGFATVSAVQDAGTEDILKAVYARNSVGGVLLQSGALQKAGLFDVVDGQPITFEVIPGQGKSFLAANIRIDEGSSVFKERYVATVDRYSYTERIGYLVVAPDVPHVSFRLPQAMKAGYRLDQIRSGMDMIVLETLATGTEFIVLKFEPMEAVRPDPNRQAQPYPTADNR